jgi:hypothetical protein
MTGRESSSNGTIYPLGRGEEITEGEYQSLYCDPDPDAMGDEVYLAACDEVARQGDAPTPMALRQPRGAWLTRDGRRLRVADMTRDHLANAVALFERGGFGEHSKIAELRAELGSR